MQLYNVSYFRSGIKYEFLSKIPVLQSPSLICGFPGTGYVGKMAVDHLITELRAIHLADIFCTSFPPRVIIGPEGVVDLTRNSLYYSKQSDSHRKDFIFVTGDAQPINPESEYYLAEEILNIVKQFQTARVVTLGAYITGTFSEKPKVYCAATHREAFQSFVGKSFIQLNDGTVTGMNGLILGIAKLFKMQGICLLGETSGYVMDAIASKSVLNTLMEITDLKVDMQTIENRAKDTEMLIKTIEQQIATKMASPGEVGGQVAPKRESDTAYIS
jgi:uncharacterized protein (TIGR00162 family)